MKKSTGKPEIYRAIAIRTIAISLVLWLFAMGLVTWAAAVEMRDSVHDNLRESETFITDRESPWNNSKNLYIPGEMEANAMCSATDGYYLLSPNRFLPIMARKDGVGSKEWLWGKWNLFFGVEPAAVFFDEEGNTVTKTGSHLLFFYAASDSTDVPQGVACIDLAPIIKSTDRNWDSFHGYPNGFGVLSNTRLKVTGFFQGNELIPQKIDMSWDSDNWSNVYTAEDFRNQPLVTVYGWELRSFIKEEVPVTREGERFSTLEDLLESRIGMEDPYLYEDSLFECILVNYRWAMSDSYGNYGVVFGVRIRPLEYAFLRLLPFMMITLVLTGLGVYWYLRWVKKHIKQPLEAVKTAEAVGVNYKPSGKLREIYEVEERYASNYQTMSQAKGELNRLNKALGYAKDAEESRRQWISNITHELKTPLAVIHSHAEGLLEDIVPEKRETYLNVILEETESLDAMVLQMLDISRLEAGKVRLNYESFFLDAMIQRVLDKFSVLAKEKKLAIKWNREGDFPVTADEVRMEQVITNLISNAVKYTPVQGEINITLLQKEHQVYFAINNTATPLTPEQLEMVWESFYRVDPSRSEPGTGLGLSLVKNIVELHGGKCFARNVFKQSSGNFQGGVEFGFTLPMK